MSKPPRTRVLLVDDSAVVRKLLGDALRKHDDIEVIGGAADPYIARDMILQHKPDVITLDIEMPRMDGLSFLRKLMEHHPIPAIVVSSLTQQGSAASVEALRIGAIDVIAKPGGPHAVGEVADRVAERIRALRAGTPIRLGKIVPAAPATPSGPAPGQASRLRGLIAIGASTGGTQAIETVLTRMPADVPPIVIAQHMPAGFTRAFAERLNGVCRMRVIEAAGNEPLERGVAYVAPGDYHLTVHRQGLRLLTRLDQKAPIHYQRPAVDALFASAATLRGLPIVAMLLTGMGADGADGMVALREAGAETIAEAEESCVVFGMPKEAIARGGAVHVASLLAIPDLVFECLGRLNRASRAS
ncbi:MAG: chemotaxis response regulator protein-glutamate methylesterase [Vicinamibacteraceae bacterium]